ncbi:MAG TPA: folylpolyglutamate synthase/dihydrofolate synthase family protein [Longimicrobiales bacterium]|nr:folylpolyglutamate synthase/dihydrofolate synthase family protein [Longimicrobiales bacterium]
MTELSYDALVDRLFPRLTGGIRWGLERTRRLLAIAGDPHLQYPTIHIGGTNGKGSVAAMTEAALRRAGARTGLYTSPHLVDFRERIQIGGRPIAEAALLDAARLLWPAIEEEAPSFFEATTVIAFLALARAGADIVVTEVGMGGRLDATNVVAPVVTAITNVAWDHAQYLGGDLATIAGEKAGIAKPGVPLVTAETDPGVLGVLRARCSAAGAPLHVVAPPAARVDRRGTGVDLDTAWGPLALRVPLAGRHQAANLALAVRVLELLPAGLRPDRASVEEGLATTRWPGRLQVARVGDADWVLDVAHNAAGVESLVAALPDLRLARPLVALVGVLGDKDWGRMLPPLFALADEVILAEPPSAPAERRWKPEAVLDALGAGERGRVVRPFPAAVREAATAGARGTVLCTGSVHTVGDALLELGIAPFPDEPGLQPQEGPP